MPLTERADGLGEWRPNPGQQTAFLRSTAYEVLYGGAAGGGKSEALLVGALRYVHLRGYRALLLRRTFKELEGSLIERSREYYAGIPGAEYREDNKIWRFHDQAGNPAGIIRFGHAEHEQDVLSYKSEEFQYEGFDELTSFTEFQYRYLLSRLRSSSGIPSRARGASNPGDVGHDWVLKRWAPWLIPVGYETDWGKYEGPSAAPGQTLHYVPLKGEERWVPPGTDGSLSRVFIPAKLEDNPVLMAADPGYGTRLEGLDPISAERQRRGNWLIKASPGLLFKRGWIKNWLEAIPEDVVQWVRYWDLAATEADPRKKNDPDWTVGILMGRTKTGRYVVADAQRTREDPGAVEALMHSTGELDSAQFGRKVVVRWGLDPGQAGKSQSHALTKQLAGMDAEGIRETGDKIVRFGPFSAQAKAGNVDFVRGPWNAKVVQLLEAFPQKGVHDDDADAISGGFNFLAPTSPLEKLRRAFQTA